MTGWITHLLAFLAGAGAGIILLAANRHRLAGSRQGRRVSDKVLQRLYKKCPEFFNDLRTELDKAEFQDVREFAIIESSQVTFVSEDVKFVYYEDELPGLKDIAATLEDEGFIDEVSRGKTPLYRMRETFVTALGFL
jgi:hypothetical protein